MAKFGNGKLTQEETGQLFYLLCEAVAGMKNSEEAATFLKDLLSYGEVEMIAKRLKIAALLEEGNTYDEIVGKLKTSPSTVARIHEWLSTSGEGFRIAMKRATPEEKLKKKATAAEPMGWRSVKKRYVSYYWPELLLEEIINSAGKRQREKFDRVMKELEKAKEKPAVYAHIKNLLSRKSL